MPYDEDVPVLSGCSPPRGGVYLVDRSYLGDPLFFGVDASPLGAVRKARDTTAVVVGAFARRGFQVNLMAGKTDFSFLLSATNES